MSSGSDAMLKILKGSKAGDKHYGQDHRRERRQVKQQKVAHKRAKKKNPKMTRSLKYPSQKVKD
jgi:hypothetical protein